MIKPLRVLLPLLLLSATLAQPLHSQEAAAAEEATPRAAALPTEIPALADALIDADFPTKRAIIDSLSTRREPEARRLLSALLEGNLSSRTADRRLVIVAGTANPPTVTDALTGETLAADAATGVNRIGVNNQLRRELRGALAGLDLIDPSEDVRMNAVQELMRTIDDDSVAILRERLTLETDADVREQIQTALAVGDLESTDVALRLAAVDTLKGSLSPEVYNRLTTIAAVAEDGTPAEADPAVRSAAMIALQGIERWRTFYGVIETLFFGLSLGSVLVLAGIGLAITFGVMGVINMAHGELMMIGAYCVYVVQQAMPQSIGSSVLIAIPLAFIISGLMGVLIERGVVRFLYGRPLETLLATFGISLILQQLARDIFSPNNRPVETPAWMAGSMRINDVLSITYTRLYIVLFSLGVFLLLLLILKRTRLGLHVRAVAQNRAMARAMGIKSEWVDAMAFGLGSGIAGVAGVALSQLTNVGPNLGQSYIVDSFMVVVFGGVGSLWGTQIGGTALGIVNKLLEPWAGAVLAKIFVLVGLILFIQRRPRGLFPQRGRAAES